jgi:hypothetical protein
VWDGVVHVFDLTGHPAATGVYAWCSPIEGTTDKRLRPAARSHPARGLRRIAIISPCAVDTVIAVKGIFIAPTVFFGEASSAWLEVCWREAASVSSRRRGLLLRASHRTGHAGLASGSLDRFVSCPDACTWVLSSSQRVASETSRPLNQAGG